MVILKYTKKDGAEYLSHLDILRTLSRTLRQTGIEIEFSKGFNPHMSLFMGAPAPLGLKSVCEYVCINTKTSANAVLSLYNDFARKGLTALSALDIEKNPNIPALTAYCEYEISLPKNANKIAHEIIMQGGIIEYERNGKIILDDFSAKIKTVEPYGESGLKIIGGAGNKTLRIDKLLSYICKKTGISESETDSLKVRLFKEDKNKLIDIDEHLGSIQSNPSV